MTERRVLEKLVTEFGNVLHVEHDDDAGELRLVVSKEVWDRAEVGLHIAVPDDLSTLTPATGGYFKLEF